MVVLSCHSNIQLAMERKLLQGQYRVLLPKGRAQNPGIQETRGR
jgi:hypothetical protein